MSDKDFLLHIIPHKYLDNFYTVLKAIITTAHKVYNETELRQMIFKE